MPKKAKSKGKQERTIQTLIEELIDRKNVIHSAVVGTTGLPIVHYLEKNMSEVTISAMASSVIAIVTEGHSMPEMGELKKAILKFDNGSIILQKIALEGKYVGVLIVYTSLQTIDQHESLLKKIEITAAKLADNLIDFV